MADRLYLRGTTWWARYYDASGKRCRVSTKCTTRDGAARVLERLESQAQGGDDARRIHDVIGLFLADGMVDLSEVTRRGHRRAAEVLVAKLGEYPSAAITPDTLDEYKQRRRRERASEDVARRELVTLRCALRFCETGSGSLRMRERRPGVIYLIREGADGPVKIGFARDLVGRLAVLQTGNPRPLIILASWRGTRDQERALHRTFAAHRLTGEWFSPAPEILALTRAVVA